MGAVRQRRAYLFSGLPAHICECWVYRPCAHQCVCKSQSRMVVACSDTIDTETWVGSLNSAADEATLSYRRQGYNSRPFTMRRFDPACDPVLGPFVAYVEPQQRVVPAVSDGDSANMLVPCTVQLMANSIRLTASASKPTYPNTAACDPRETSADTGAFPDNR